MASPLPSSPEPPSSRFPSSPPPSERESSLGLGQLASESASYQTSAPASTAPSSPVTHTSVEERRSPTQFELNEDTKPGGSAITPNGDDGMEIDLESPLPQIASDKDAFDKLQHVLEKSALYSSILKQRMDEDKALQLASLHEARRVKSQKDSPATKRRAKLSPNGKKHVFEDESDDELALSPKRRKLLGKEVDDTEIDESIKLDDIPIFSQPALVSGAKLKPYQLEGLQWMVALHHNGISGILGDEMGLGKTLQTISFCAHLREQKFQKPFLVVCPLSVMHNWVEEFAKFAPSIPVCMYHGTPAERAELRRTVMPLSMLSKGEDLRSRPPPSLKKSRKGRQSENSDDEQADGKSEDETSEVAYDDAEYQGSEDEVSRPAKGRSRLGRAAKSNIAEVPPKKPPTRGTRGGRGRGRGGAKGGKGRSVMTAKPTDKVQVKGVQTKLNFQRAKKTKVGDVSDSKRGDDVELSGGGMMTQNEANVEDEDNSAMNFPVVVTTYEMIIKDRIHLTPYDWGYIVVDEGHRLKNLDCKLIKEIKKYSSAGRMILTGTPLHNNLAELWSLLNFVLPDIFNNVDQFQEWFNLPEMQSSIGSERSSRIIEALHAILKPFLLRRLKADVEFGLPPKKEYVLYAPLTSWQHEVYGKVLDGALRGYLLGQKRAVDGPQAGISKGVDVDAPRRMRSSGVNGKKRGQKSYAVDGDDDEYFERLERGQLDERGLMVPEDEDPEAMAELARQHHYKAAAKQVNNMKLQNTVMQLRKVCSHPFLFEWPTDPRTRQPVLDDRLVNSSGKMLVLDRLLTELFRRKHKVLLFSQFTTMLDVIEDWAIEFKGWKLCRIDGSTSPLDRRDQMNSFQQGGDSPNAPCLFLLSTRAGGLGINLTAADTVIFYDQDWNPQMDAQAQDRAHRIGQTKPVLIFRLVSAHTIETRIMQKATEKRKLEALVIAKGKFRKPAAAARAGKSGTVAELAADLLKLEGEKIEVVQDSEAGKASVLSDTELDMLLDRRPEVFADRKRGWTSAQGNTEDSMVNTGAQEHAGKTKTAFAVYEAPPDEGSDALAKMMGEEMV